MVGVAGIMRDDKGRVLLLRHLFWAAGTWGRQAAMRTSSPGSCARRPAVGSRDTGSSAEQRVPLARRGHLHRAAGRIGARCCRPTFSRPARCRRACCGTPRDLIARPVEIVQAAPPRARRDGSAQLRGTSRAMRYCHICDTDDRRRGPVRFLVRRPVQVRPLGTARPCSSAPEGIRRTANQVEGTRHLLGR
jgi:hypothetical protein